MILSNLLVLMVLAQDQTGSVQGTIVDSMTHQPVRKAMVSLDGPGLSGKHSGFSDTNGGFRFEHLRTGQYWLTIQHLAYPQTRFGMLRKAVSIKAGEEGEPVAIELLPGATVSGRVVDEDGDALNQCSVRAETKRGLSGHATTDHGDFRIAGLLPGAYLVTAECQDPVFQPRALSSGPDPPPDLAYQKQSYPVELSAGMERSGVEFKMGPVHVTHIHVTFSGGEDWRGRKDLGWELVAPDGANGWHPVDTRTGQFDIPQVFPGSYLLIVTARNDDGASAMGAVRKLEVKDTPIKTTIQMRRPFDVNGTVQVEDRSGSQAPRPGTMRVELVAAYPYLNMVAPSPVNADGSFTVKAAFPGPSRLQVRAGSAFVKAAWLGNTQLTEGLVDLSSGPAGDLRILISTNTASVHGTAHPGYTVWVSQSGYRRSAQTGENGTFQVDGLPPGAYRILATEEAEPRLEDAGQEITLAEGEIKQIELK